MIRSLSAVCLSATLACASFAVNAAAPAGNAAAGKAKVYTCHGCHGIPGYENAYPNYHVPRIAGQNEQYLVNALHEYQSGDRTHPTMGAQADSLSDQDIADIAAYLSSFANK
ncbi:MAG TPA: cytochrome c [Rhodanobacteraceae bacterium]|nr:cytochrome c [Rhodanobacteraceae bacterium]